MDDDWGLNAIVRSCTNAAATPLAEGDASLQVDRFLVLPDLLTQPRLLDMQNTHELHDLFKPFSPKSKPRNFPLLCSLQDLSPIPPLPPPPPPPPTPPPPPPPPQQSPEQKQRSSCSINTSSCASISPSNRPCPKTRRRKQLQKRVCQVPAEGLSSDVWSWRKYGQKPIKGSPYPRGYYKCSTSKLCMARKQVERCRSDPSMFILTYTAEHNHPMPPAPRNQVAGIIRQKPDSSPAGKDSGNQLPSSGVSPEKVSSRVMEELLDEIDGGIGVDETVVSDDFFEGLDELAGQVIGDTVFN